jgi:hypothetical protein
MAGGVEGLGQRLDALLEKVIGHELVSSSFGFMVRKVVGPLAGPAGGPAGEQQVSRGT